MDSPAERAESIARDASFQRVELPGTGLTSFAKAGPARQLAIYIESDGAPWRARNEPPLDPTPLKALVLRLALADPSAGVAYVGRPCQYLSKEELLRCDPVLWTQGRFRADAVAATNEAIDRLKAVFRADRVDLVGYSGGGAMAALVAARRDDVGCLVTIAAPLDTRAWTTALGVSTLASSLNPSDSAERLNSVRQTHFRGLRDVVVPPRTTGRYFEKSGVARVIDLENFDHACCWEDAWARLRQQSCLTQ